MATTRSRSGLTGRAIKAYIREAESWKDAGGEPSDLLAFEEFLGVAVAAFEAISQWDTLWHAKAHTGLFRYDEAGVRRILDLYSDWLAPNLLVEETIRRFEHAGMTPTNSARYLHCRDEAKGIESPSDEIGGEMRDLEAEAIEAHRRGETFAMTEMGHR